MHFDSVTWAEFAASIVSFVRLPRITMVHWSSPSLSVVKLNSDGCSKWNPGPSGGDAVLRDSSGAFIFTYSCYFGIVTSLAAEVRALLWELSCAFQEVIIFSILSQIPRF